jgi:hypothetical protein
MNSIDHFEVNKMHAAHRQLNVAIRLHFSGDDPVAVLTLAGAAATIFTDLVNHRCPERSWDKQAQQAVGLSPKEYFAIIRRGQNFLKHADGDPDDAIRWSVDDTEGLIMGACMNAGLLDDLSPSAYVFKRWYIAKYRSRFPTDWEPGGEATKFFPDLAQMSDEEQRAFGARRVDEVEAQAG